eukprot:283623-Prymnesium_polylepis.1
MQGIGLCLTSSAHNFHHDGRIAFTQTDTARRPARRARSPRSDPTETHASHERTGPAGSNGSGQNVKYPVSAVMYSARADAPHGRNAFSGGGNL